MEGCLRPPFDTARVCWTRTRSVPRRRESPRSVRSSKLKSPSAPVGGRFCAALWAKMRRKGRDCAQCGGKARPAAHVKKKAPLPPTVKIFPQIEKFSVGRVNLTLHSSFRGIYSTHRDAAKTPVSKIPTVDVKKTKALMEAVGSFKDADFVGSEASFMNQ